MRKKSGIRNNAWNFSLMLAEGKMPSQGIKNAFIALNKAMRVEEKKNSLKTIAIIIHSAYFFFFNVFHSYGRAKLC